MDNENCAAATRSELAHGLREHYEKAATAISHWCNQIPIAIDLWEKCPEVETRIAALEEQLAEAKESDVLKENLDIVLSENKRLRAVISEAKKLREENRVYEFEMLDPQKLWDLIDDLDRAGGEKHGD